MSSDDWLGSSGVSLDERLVGWVCVWLVGCGVPATVWDFGGTDRLIGHVGEGDSHVTSPQPVAACPPSQIPLPVPPIDR
jgi:hypothetical protein